MSDEKEVVVLANAKASKGSVVLASSVKPRPPKETTSQTVTSDGDATLDRGMAGVASWRASITMTTDRIHRGDSLVGLGQRNFGE